MRLKLSLFFPCCLLLGISCKKVDTVTVKDSVAINVVNAVTGGQNVKLIHNQYDSAVNNNFKIFAIQAGVQKIYICPVRDSLKPYYNQDKLLQNGDIYSLYLSGIPAAIDTIWKKEALPFYSYKDSVFGLRFINLSYNSYPVNVTVLTTPTVHEFENIAYKTITEFKTYSGLSTDKSYTFQVRKASNDSLITSIVLNPTPRFKLITLALRGAIGGTGTSSLGLIRVDDH